MNISEIVGDAVRYPFSDWKKILILGLLTLFAELNTILQTLGFKNSGLILFSLIVLVLVFFFIGGYQYRIIKSSLNNVKVLPEFNAWLGMFIDGVKVSIVGIIYLIPGILILIAGIFMLIQFGMVVPNLSSIILILIAVLYIIIIIPISYMAISYMADNDSKLGVAFRLRKILNKISSIGWIKFILWYIVTGIISLIILIVGSVVTGSIGLLTFPTLGIILMSLLVAPYLYMFIYRSVALFYISK
jgi:hypothetical protein